MTIRMWAGYNPETLDIMDTVEYTGDNFKRLSNLTYIEIFPPLHLDAIEIKRNTLNEIVVVQNDDKWNTIFKRQLTFIRQIRNGLLSETDYTQLGDVKSQEPDKWIEYRQKLRDITDTITDPFHVTWPIRPDAEDVDVHVE
jgi:hypothetical protein